jgi:hypothetical protein
MAAGCVGQRTAHSAALSTTATSAPNDPPTSSHVSHARTLHVAPDLAECVRLISCTCRFRLCALNCSEFDQDPKVLLCISARIIDVSCVPINTLPSGTIQQKGRAKFLYDCSELPKNTKLLWNTEQVSGFLL